MTKSQRASLLLGLALALPLAFSGMAWAGGASLDEDEEDQSNAGVSFFGICIRLGTRTVSKIRQTN